MIRFRFGPYIVTRDDGVWEAPERPELAELLTAMFPAGREWNLSPGYDPNPEQTFAKHVIAEVGGEILYVDPPGELPPGAIP